MNLTTSNDLRCESYSPKHGKLARVAVIFRVPARNVRQTGAHARRLLGGNQVAVRNFAGQVGTQSFECLLNRCDDF